MSTNINVVQESCSICGQVHTSTGCNPVHFSESKMTNEKDREEARVLLGKLSDLFENAFHDTDDDSSDHIFDSPEEEMIDAIATFRSEAVKAERERLREPLKDIVEDHMSDHKGYNAVSGAQEQKINAALGDIDDILSDDQEASKHDMDCERELMGSDYLPTCRKPVKEEGRG